MSGLSPCPAWASDLTAFVDGALTPIATEETASHVASCPGCRSEVAELRRLREVFVTPAASSQVPDSLEQQLVAIAGGHHDRELWLSTGPAAALPSPREHRRRALALVAGITLVVLGAVTGMAWSVAPDVALVDDVTEQARAELRIARADSVNEAELSALLVAHNRGVSTISSIPVAHWSTGLAEGSLAISGAAVSSLLSGVSRAEHPFAATGSSCLQRGSEWHCATVKVERGGLGEIRVTVLDRDGSVIVHCVASEQIDLSQLHEGDSYRLRGWSQLNDADMLNVEAVRPTGKLRTRWRINPGLGLVGSVEAFDAAGRRQEISWLRSFTLTPPRTVATPTRSMSNAQFTLESTSGPACSGGFVCPDELVGLGLRRLSADSTSQPQFVHAVYGDGDRVISVIQQRGRLEALAGADTSTQDAAQGEADEPLVTAWQSGDVVLSVTSSSDDLTEQAAAQLPHRHVPSEAWQRLRAGMQQITSGGD